MAIRPMTSEEIALTEKKMDMTLDDIIKLSKTNAKKPQKQQRVSNKAQKFVNNVSQGNSLKVRRFMDTRSSLRQGVLAKKRSNFQQNQFTFTAKAAKKASTAPIRGRSFNRSRPFNKPRVAGQTGQKNAMNGGSFTVKKPLGAANIGPMQRPQTLDSRFANMKEERMRVFSPQNNGPRRNRGGQPRIPWARGHLQN